MGSVGDSSIYIESAASWPSAIVGEIVGVCKGRLADIFLLHPALQPIVSISDTIPGLLEFGRPICCQGTDRQNEGLTL